MSDTTVWVHADLEGEAHVVGQLIGSVARGKEAATFLYAEDWLEAPHGFALQPALQLSQGPYYSSPGRAVFGAIADSAPDRWGQTLMRRHERRKATAEGRAPRALREIDFLLGVTDTARQGAFRFALSPSGSFLAPERPGGVPPLVELPGLLAATERILRDEDSAEDLALLLAPGSSLGGARPKASVRGTRGELLIAKFPKPDDEYRVVAWEAVALELARRAGIPVPLFRLEEAAGRDVLLVGRFDRRGAVRVPFLSAMSMLDALAGQTRSYPEIADVLRQHGSDAPRDLEDLWRRMVLTVLISNTDDHLRNHGFLYDGVRGWRLSPAYDLTPVPADIKPRVLATALTLDGDPTASLDLALESAEFF